MKIKRVLGILLSIALVLGLMPQMSSPAYALDNNYLTFTGTANFTITVGLHEGNLQYRTPETSDWSNLTSGTPIQVSNSDHILYLRGSGNNNKQLFDYMSHIEIESEGTVSCDGDIRTLIDYTAPENAIMGAMCFDCMFYGCRSLTKGPDLPATNLTDHCYYAMFDNCESLEEAPALPATTLANNCYGDMFYGCKSLTKGPDLPATTLANSCYSFMFENCKSLKEAPALPATTLANSCYNNMFQNCKSLKEAPALPATTLADYCYSSMFENCESLEEAPALPATTLAQGCYSSMFYGCTKLEEAPALPATTLAKFCYNFMFNYCAGIKLSEIENDEYSIPYRVPASGDGIEAQGALDYMFNNTGGTFNGTPNINTTYYMKPRVITYTATFDTNGGTGTMEDVTGLNGEWTLPDCGFTAPSGKVFDQWKITQSSSEASVESPASTYKKPGETYNVNGDITVKALWKEVATIETSPAAKNLTYNGSEQELVTAGTTTDGAVYYALGSDANTAPADNLYNTVIPKGINVGPYYVYYKVVGDDTHADSEVFGPVTVTIGKGTITPTVNITGWTYGETASTPSVSGNLGSGNVTYTYSTSENGTYTSTVPTNAGTYYIKANVSETDNYNTAVSAPVSFTIAKKALTDAMLTLGTSAFVHDGNTKTPSYTVTDGTKTLIAGTDYTVDSTSVTSASAYGTYTIKVNGTGNYTGSASNAWNITDETNPSAEISIEESKFKTFLNTITFGLFFNKTETVSITATDLESGVSKIEYVVTDTAVASIDELNDIEEWTSVEGATASFVKEADDKFIVYAKVTDNAGNVTYVSSDGIILDSTAPVIKVDKETVKEKYAQSVSWSVTDENLKDVIITYTKEEGAESEILYNEEVTETLVNSETNLKDTGKYSIKATDKAGNITEVTFEIVNRITEVILESDDVEETDVKDVTVPELNEFTESQPEAAVEVTMEVNVVDEDSIKNDVGEAVLKDIKEAIDSAFSGIAKTDLNQEYLDIVVLKSVNGGKQEEVTDLNRIVEIAVKYDLTGKFNPVIVREHDKKVSKFERLSKRPSASDYKDGTFFVSGSGEDAVIYIYSRYFSTYTLAYSTTASYQVTFDDMQNNINQVVVADGNKVSKPTDPTREGYTFEGWYVEGSTEKYDFDKAINGDLTLVAKWKEVEKTTPTPAPTEAPAKTTTTTTSSNSPKTGDVNNYYGFWMLLASAGFVASYMALKRSRKEI